jgi:hypothetical protein
VGFFYDDGVAGSGGGDGCLECGERSMIQVVVGLLDISGAEVGGVLVVLMVFGYLYPCMLVVDDVSESLWKRGGARCESMVSDYFGKA